MSDPLSSNFDPTREKPLFIAQYTTCAYPVSDLWGSSPRYLYYALLLLVFVTQKHGWLANVFLGAAATYAGTAAIEAFILISNPQQVPAAQNVTIPLLDSDRIAGNATLSGLENLVTDYASVSIAPATLELDIDAILAVVVTGYLMMLPMHCCASVVRRNRARHLLMSLWNALMLAGTACALALWVELYGVPLQFQFCYPELTDSGSVTNDGNPLPAGIWQGGWNATVWHTFQNFSQYAQLDTNCLYPCFDSSRILRRANTLVTSLDASTRSPRTNPTLTDMQLARIDRLQELIYAAIAISIVAAILILVFTWTPTLRRATRVPIAEPKTLLTYRRGEIFRTLARETAAGCALVASSAIHPHATIRALGKSQRTVLFQRLRHVARYLADVMALVLLFIAIVLMPVIIVAFVVWIEWQIHDNEVSIDSPAEVGQWSPVVSIVLVLVSALVLKLKYRIASSAEIEAEMQSLRAAMENLEEVLKKKEARERRSMQVHKEATVT